MGEARAAGEEILAGHGDEEDGIRLKGASYVS